MSLDKPDLSGDPNVWHEGERAMQAAVGKRADMEKRGRVILRDHMPDQHRLFFAEREQLFLGLLDEAGYPWATLVEGDTGFITSPAPQILAIATLPEPADPARAGLLHGAPVGVLGLEFSARRRNRLSGAILYADGAKGFMVQVVQSFGNCPKYIQARRPISELDQSLPPAATPAEVTDVLTDQHAALIASADTFFIASRSAAPGLVRSEGLDVSHRGGLPGFVVAESTRRLVVPDYRGNNFFNTIGNLKVDARCGLLFIDFATGATLQLIGRGEVLNDAGDSSRWPAAERAIAVNVERAVYTRNRVRVRYAFESFAPEL